MEVALDGGLRTLQFYAATGTLPPSSIWFSWPVQQQPGSAKLFLAPTNSVQGYAAGVRLSRSRK
jgi:hypothetical protein